MKKIQHHMLHASCALLLTASLAACNSGEAPLPVTEELTEELAIGAANAARPAPCVEQFAYERELNGAPDDTYIGAGPSAGVVQEEYWYAATSSVVYFTYMEDGGWCNSWTESGVTWRR